MDADCNLFDEAQMIDLFYVLTSDQQPICHLR